jgi:archaellum biogenesis ATPase FlaH
MRGSRTREVQVPDPASLRGGHDYQDLFAMRAILELIAIPDGVQFVALEADYAGSIDDIVVRYRDNREERLQIKFAVDECDLWTWDRLTLVETTSVSASSVTGKPASRSRSPKTTNTKPTRARSLLFKWFDSLQIVPPNVDVTGRVVTNRGFDDGVWSVLDDDHHIVIEKLPDAIRAALISRYGSEDAARTIAARLQFNVDSPSFDEMEAQVRARFSQLLNPVHYLRFKDQVRIWGRQQKHRHGAKLIDLEEARRVTSFYDFIPLPEGLEVPADFVAPNLDFDDRLGALLSGPESRLIIIEGDAGAGKSTYMSDLYRRLLASGVPAVRHHFWLSSTDPTADRTTASNVFGTLMAQLALNAAEDLGSHIVQSPEPTRIREWLDAAAASACAHHRSIVVLLDGLDHALVRDTMAEAHLVLGELVAPREGLKVVLATRPAHYPQAVRDRSRTDLPLPRLSRSAIAALIHANAATISVADEHNESPEATFDRFVDSFAERTAGLALHARVALRILQSYDRPVTVADVIELPAELAEGATSFYAGIWASLDTDAQVVLHLLAEHPLPWHERELVWALRDLGLTPGGAATAIVRVRYLLEHAPDGTLSIHYSLYSFVRNTPQHAALGSQLDSAMRRFLADALAPEAWRWGYLPELQLRGPEAPAVVHALDHRWFADAIAEGRDAKALQRIAVATMLAALRMRDLPGFIAVGTYYDYYVDVSSIDDEILLMLQVVAARDQLRKNPAVARHAAMASATLRDVVIELARDGEADRAGPLYSELQRRANEAFSREARDESAFAQFVSPWIAAAGALGLGSQEIADLIVANVSNPFPGRIAQIYIRQSARFGNYGASACVLRAAGAAGEKGPATRAFGEGLLQSGAPFNVQLAAQLDLQVSSVRFLCALHGVAPATPVARATLPGLSSDYQVAQDLRQEWCDALHDMIADAFVGSSLTASSILALVGLRPGMRHVTEHLTTALAIFRMLPAGRITMTDALQSSPDLLRNRSRTNSNFNETQSAWAFHAALCDVLLDCAAAHAIERLTTGDIESLLVAGTTLTGLADSLEGRPLAATLAALDVVIERVVADADGSLAGRSERASMYRVAVGLSRSLGRHKIARTAASKTGHALMSLGWHKDMFLSSVLQAIEAIGEHDGALARSLLEPIAAPIAHVHDFTDSDHTRYFPEELGEALMSLDPQSFIRYFSWLVASEDLFTVLKLRRDYLLRAGANTDSALGLLRTIRDEDTLRSLLDGAAEPEVKTLAGQLLHKSDDADEEHSYEPRYESNSERSETSRIPVEDIPPERLLRLDAQEWFRVDFLAWANYWLRSVSSDEAWASLRKVLRGEHYAVPKEQLYRVVLELRGAADAYFVLAASLSWTAWSDFGAEESERATDLVRLNHPERLSSFIFDALLIEYERSRQFRPHTSGMVATIVRHLIATERVPEATLVTRKLVDVAKHLTSSWRFERPEWL